MKITTCLLFIALISSVYAQESAMDKLPYEQIPDYPEDYTSGNIVSRLIDGLGYRYYWATEGLSQEDLDYRPSKEARSTFETLEHLYGLSDVIANASLNLPNIRPVDWPEMSYETLRSKTLLNLQKASEAVRSKSAEEVANLSITYLVNEKKSEYPYRHLINGPIADALYHTGQVVSFRRSSGNPINPKVNVFMGKTGE